MTTKQRLEEIAIAAGINPATIWSMTLLGFAAAVADANAAKAERRAQTANDLQEWPKSQYRIDMEDAGRGHLLRDDE